MNNFGKVLHNPYKVLSWAITGTSVGRILSDKTYLSIKYKSKFGKRLDWENPKSFNEKLQWLKLYDRKPIYTTMVDKYEVKKYVASIIGEEYIIPTLGVWERFEDIDFSKLPDQFVLKCTHDSGGLVICKDKKRLDVEAARKKINRCLKKNFYWLGREWPYKNVKPRIIAEKYMEDTGTGELRDYKFFCFGGQARCAKIDFDRFIEHHANYFDIEGNLLPFGEESYPPDENRVINFPENMPTMVRLSEILSKETPFLRADFYDVNGDVYFGELTFFPYSGFEKFTNDDWDYQLGSWIKLPESCGGVRLDR